MFYGCRKKNSLNNFCMARNVAIVGAGVSGLTCAVVFAERGIAPHPDTTDWCGHDFRAAAAIWYPYDAEPAAKTIVWHWRRTKLCSS
jgi:D-amino-acid oxidase